jgi:hypothetical protein
MAASANTAAPAPGNPDFAEHARADAKRVSRDGLGLALAIYAALIVVASLSGAFGTHQIEPGPRFAFWTAVILWNAMKWHLWLMLAHRRFGWPVAIATGAVILNLGVPFETRLALGFAPALPMSQFLRIYLSAVAISAISGVACIAIVRYFGFRRGLEAAKASPPSAESEPHTIFGVARDALWAIQAEDHYVRLLLADGRAPLVGGRFGDALAEVASIAGCRIHRGCWVADSAVAGVERAGRGWRVALPDGRRLTVSASHVGSVRERGWMGRTAAP